jgi:hypothetical protein
MKILDVLRSRRDHYADLVKSLDKLRAAEETAQLNLIEQRKKTDPDDEKSMARLTIARSQADAASLRFRKAQDEIYAIQTEMLDEASNIVRGWSRFVLAKAVACREQFYDVLTPFWPDRGELVREHENTWIPKEQAIRRCGALVDHVADNLRPFELLRDVDRMNRIICETCETYQWTLPETLRSLERVVSPEAQAAALLMRQRRVVYLSCVPEKSKADYKAAQKEIAQHVAAPDWQPPALVNVIAKEDCAFAIRNVKGPGTLVFPTITTLERREDEKIERTQERLGIKLLKKGDKVQLLRFEWAGLSRYFDLVETRAK